jgi:hypothetical protein
MESNLSRTIAAYLDDQPTSDGSWANAWVPVWEKATVAHPATPHHWAVLSAPRAVATFTPANAPEAETEQEETLYV